MEYSQEEMVTEIRKQFPDGNTGEIFTLLGEYGVEEHHKQAPEVRMTILKRSEGDMTKFYALVEKAKSEGEDFLS